MTNVVPKAKVDFEHMKTAPPVLEPTQQGTDIVMRIADNAEPLVSAWDPLMKRVGLFVTIVDKIAEVWHTNK